MHALRHVHRLLVPAGTLVDVHPIASATAEAGDRILGIIEEPDFIGRELPNAERRLAQAVEAGLYVLEATTAFDVLQHFDAPEELLEAYEPLATQPALTARIRAASAPLVTREHVVLRRLRAGPAHAARGGV